MIRTFRHKGLKELFEAGTSKSIPADMRKRIRRRLDVLDAAENVDGMNVPGWNLHPLKGKRAGDWAITVTGNYRITFQIEDRDVFSLDLEDYH